MIWGYFYPIQQYNIFLALRNHPIVSNPVYPIKNIIRRFDFCHGYPTPTCQNWGFSPETTEDDDLSIRTFCRRDVCIGFVQQEGHDVLIQVETLRVRVNHRLTACESRQHTGFDLSEVTDAEFVPRRSRERGSDCSCDRSHQSHRLDRLAFFLWVCVFRVVLCDQTRHVERVVPNRGDDSLAERADILARLEEILKLNASPTPSSRV